MSILIAGMEMPTEGTVIAIYKLNGKFYASVHGTELCPLVPVPPHGDLIEESSVLNIVSEWCPDDDGSVSKDGDLREMLDEIEALPTVIEAEGEE